MKIFQFFTFVIFVIVFISTTESCGGLTHNIIAHRALHWFSLDNTTTSEEYANIIATHQNAFQNGATFPDWGYSCFLNNFGYEVLANYSEATHWPPFQNATIKYIRNTYSKPWNEDAQQLIAFLMGVLSHAVADISWHNLEIVGATSGQGFIEAMAQVIFQGYYGASHSEADVGGEFVGVYETDTSFIVSEWHLPSHDLTNIFHSMNLTVVTPDILESCNYELFAATQALEDLPSEVLYDHFASSSSFLVDHYQDWWIGGLNDMAVWTQWCWPDVIYGLENGPTNTSICLVESQWSWNNGSIFRSAKAHEQFINKMRPFVDHERIKVERNEKHTVFHYKKEKQTGEKVIENSKKSNGCINEQGTQNSVSFLTNIPFSNVGTSVAVADFNKDGRDDIAIGAPGVHAQTGAVYVMFGAEVTGNQQVFVEISANVTLTGEGENHRFGFAVVALDFNLDGYMDLVVSAPGMGADQLIYHGHVYIFFGSPEGLSSEADVHIESTLDYSNLGITFHTGDINGDGNLDLFIGSPFANQSTNINWTETGELWVFLSSQKRKSGILLGANDTDWYAVGELNYEWFGYSAGVAVVGSKRLFLVGSPLFQNRVVSSPVGKITAFDVTLFDFESNKYKSLEEKKRTSQNNIAWILRGSGSNDVNSQLGLDFAIGSPYGNGEVMLALSLPTKALPPSHFWDSEMNQAGSVHLYSMDKLGGNITTDDIQAVTTFNSDQGYARYGWDVGFYDLNNDGTDDLFITEPYHSNGDFTNVDNGALFTWLGGESFPLGTLDDSVGTSDLCVSASFSKGLFGRKSVALNYNGDNSMDLLVTAPRDQSMVANGGSVYLLISS